MEKRPPQKAAATKANPGAQSGVTVPQGRREETFWFSGGVRPQKRRRAAALQIGRETGPDLLTENLRGGV